MGENADESDTEVGKPGRKPSTTPFKGRPAMEHCVESGFQKSTAQSNLLGCVKLISVK